MSQQQQQQQQQQQVESTQRVQTSADDFHVLFLAFCRNLECKLNQEFFKQFLHPDLDVRQNPIHC